MGRYRAPQPPSSKYITPAGFDSLNKELDILWKVTRPEVTRIVSAAAAQGDRSENADYIYGKRRLREIDSRIHFLRKRLDHIVVVNSAPSNLDRIYFAAWIELKKSDDVIQRYRIVGPDEYDLKQNLISLDSPLAKALIGKAVGDRIVITLPNGKEEYQILKISYTDNLDNECKE